MRRVVLVLVPLAALAALGFLQGSAVGGQSAPRLSTPVFTATLVNQVLVPAMCLKLGPTTPAPAMELQPAEQPPVPTASASVT